jgi:hypothetical protein
MDPIGGAQAMGIQHYEQGSAVVITKHSAYSRMEKASLNRKIN